MRRCPHCGQPVRAVAPDISIEMLQLPRKERQILEELLDAYPRYVRNTFLEGRLYDDEREDEVVDPQATIQSHVSKLRKKLKPLGIGIECPRFVGYRLVLPLAEASTATGAPR